MIRLSENFAQEPILWECKAGELKPLTQAQYDKQHEKIQRHYTKIPAVAAQKLVDALRMYMSAGIGNSTDFEIQAKAFEMATSAFAEFSAAEEAAKGGVLCDTRW